MTAPQRASDGFGLLVALCQTCCAAPFATQGRQPCWDNSLMDKDAVKALAHGLEGCR